MNKILIMPSNKKQFSLDCDGIIIGIKGLSTNITCFDLDDIKNINKEVFISLNKNMFNSDIEYLKKTLLKLNDYHIKGVIFYDIAVVNLSKKLQLNYNLIWSQEHMVTNYDTINFWYEQGAQYAYISNDITLREIKEIINNTESKLLLTTFGYIPIFNSKRKLITNYLKTFNLKNKGNNCIEKEGHNYPIVEDDGTIVYTDFILNGLEESINLDIEYIVLNTFRIDDKKFKKVLDIFKNTNINNLEKNNEELTKMFNNLEKGFFYKDVVYKVK